MERKNRSNQEARLDCLRHFLNDMHINNLSIKELMSFIKNSDFSLKEEPPNSFKSCLISHIQNPFSTEEGAFFFRCLNSEEQEFLHSNGIFTFEREAVNETHLPTSRPPTDSVVITHLKQFHLFSDFTAESLRSSSPRLFERLVRSQHHVALNILKRPGFIVLSEGVSEDFTPEHFATKDGRLMQKAILNRAARR